MALNTTYQYEQPKIPSSWLKDDETRRFYNRLIEVLDDVYLKYGRFDVNMFSESGLQSVINATEKTMASEIESSTVTTNVLKTALAEMIGAKIGTANIDYSHITDLNANRIFTDSEVAGKINANSLEISSAQIVDLIVNSFRLVNDEGQVYKVTIDSQGKLLTDRVSDEDAMFADGKIPSGYSAVASSLNVGDVTSGNLYVTGAADVMKLTAKYLSADSAFINELVSTTVFAKYLMANKAFVNSLYTSTIYGGKSIKIIAGETDNSVAGVATLYAIGSSGTEAPTTGWSTAMPTRTTDSQYVWQKVLTTYNSGNTEESEPACITGAKGEDATLLRIDSSRGTVFKNNEVSTVLSAVIYRGGERITDIDALHSTFGSSAYIQWSWQRVDENRFGVISSSDSRIGDNGFTFTLSPEDVDTKVTFMCELIV